MDAAVYAADPAFLSSLREALVRRRTPGRSSDPAENGIRSEPRNQASTTAAAPLKVLCPDVYSGNGGVASNGIQDGSGSVAGLPSVAASWMAVIGLHKL